MLDVSLLMSPAEKYSQALTLEVVKSCVRRIEMANLIATRRQDWVLRMSPSSEFLSVDPSSAISVAGDGTISGMTHGAQRLMARTLDIDWKWARGLIGKPFEDVFDLDFNDLPYLIGADSARDQAIDMRDGNIIFADVQQPPLKRSYAARAAIPTALARIHGGDPAMRRLVEKATRIVDKQISIILEGETGVGKEFVAKILHEARKKSGPFVAINCAALPETLIESELFGYAPHAFTGANQKGKKGLIEQADGGTLFLDEIGDMPLALQARLLRVLAEREVMAVGATKPVPVDLRVVCATHRNLKELVDRGQFRQDLYYRLNGVVLSIPALRERTDRDWILQQIASRASPSRPLRFAREAEQALLSYSWPGNIREMMNVIELCLALSDGETISIADLPEHILAQRT